MKKLFLASLLLIIGSGYGLIAQTYSFNEVMAKSQRVMTDDSTEIWPPKYNLVTSSDRYMLTCAFTDSLNKKYHNGKTVRKIGFSVDNVIAGNHDETRLVYITEIDPNHYVALVFLSANFDQKTSQQEQQKVEVKGSWTMVSYFLRNEIQDIMKMPEPVSLTTQ